MGHHGHSNVIVIDLLRNRGLLTLLLGQLLSTLGIWSLRTVLLIWVYSIAHSGAAVSLVGLAEVVPLILLAPVSGVFIDRWPRRLIMAGGVAVAIVSLLPLLALSGSEALPAMIAVAVVSNAAVQISFNAAAAAIPVIAGPEGVAGANSLAALINGGIAIVGPALAAVLVAALGFHGAVIVVVLVLCAAVPVFVLVPAPKAVRETEAGSIAGEFRDGIAYVLRSRLLLSLTIMVTVAGLGFGGLSVLDVVFVTRALHLPSNNVGLLLSSAGFGELAGGIVMSTMAGRLSGSYHTVLGGGIVIAGAALVAYSTTRSLAAAVAATGTASFVFPAIIVAFSTLQQRATSDAFMGRVNSTINTTLGASMLLSLVGAGALTDLVGVRTAIATGGVILLLSGALSLVIIRETPPVPETPLA